MSENEKTILKTLKEKKIEHLIEVVAFEDKENSYLILMELGLSTDLKSLPNRRETCLQVYI